MSDIAKVAGMQKASLYHYFSSKQDVLAELHLDYAKVLIARLERRKELDISPSAKLLEVMVDLIEVVHDRHSEVISYWENRRYLDPDNQRQVHDQRMLYQDEVEKIVQECVAAGEFRPVDTHMATFAIFGMVSWAMHWYSSGGPYDPRMIAQSFWDFMVRGLSADN
jgi:AcrR family transcriptional regulator